MKNIPILIVIAISLLVVGFTQNTKSTTTDSQRIDQIENRLALKALVDKFSILADKKDVAAQMNLFTENAAVESFRNGVSNSKLTGKEEIGNAFSGFLSLFETVYHINGQQTVDISGDKATGISYCLVVLIGEQDGQKMKTTLGVSYEDEYAKQNGKWLIANRKSYFNWQEATAID